MNQNGHKVDFLVVTAMKEEYDALVSLLPNPETAKVGRVNFVDRLDSPLQYRIAVVICGQTTAKALAATLEEIEKFNPRAVILTGIAAGFHESGVGLGDILVPHFIVPYGYKKSQEVTEDGVITHSLATSTNEAIPSRKVIFEHRGDLIIVSEPLWESALNLSCDKTQPWLRGIRTTRPESSPGNPNIHVGIRSKLGSGDELVATELSETRAWLIREYSREAVGLEMEAYGVITACRQRDKPCLVVKAVQDLATTAKDDQSVKDKWRQYAAEAAASFSLCLIKSYAFPDSGGRDVEITPSAGVPLRYDQIRPVNQVEDLFDLTMDPDFLEQPLPEHEYQRRLEQDIIRFEDPDPATELESLLGSHRIVLITGEPLVGKTTTLLHFCHTALTKRLPWRVFFVNPHATPEEMTRSLDTIPELMSATKSEPDHPHTEDLKVLLLVDGLRRAETESNFIEKSKILFDFVRSRNYRLVSTIRDDQKVFLEERLRQNDVDLWTKYRPHNWRLDPMRENILKDVGSGYMRYFGLALQEGIDEDEFLRVIAQKTMGLAGDVVFLLEEAKRFSRPLTIDDFKQYPVGSANIRWYTLQRNYSIHGDEVIPLFVLLLNSQRYRLASSFLEDFVAWAAKDNSKDLQNILRKTKLFTEHYTHDIPIDGVEVHWLRPDWKDAISKYLDVGVGSSVVVELRQFVHHYRQVSLKLPAEVAAHADFLVEAQKPKLQVPTYDAWILVADVNKIWGADLPRLADKAKLDSMSNASKALCDTIQSDSGVQGRGVPFDYVKRTLVLVWQQALDSISEESHFSTIEKFYTMLRESEKLKPNDYWLPWKLGEACGRIRGNFDELDFELDSITLQGTAKALGIFYNKIKNKMREFPDTWNNKLVRYELLEIRLWAAERAIELCAAIPQNWHDLGDVLYRLGLTYFDNQEFDKAQQYSEIAAKAFERAIEAIEIWSDELEKMDWKTEYLRDLTETIGLTIRVKIQNADIAGARLFLEDKRKYLSRFVEGKAHSVEQALSNYQAYLEKEAVFSARTGFRGQPVKSELLQSRVEDAPPLKAKLVAMVNRWKEKGKLLPKNDPEQLVHSSFADLLLFDHDQVNIGTLFQKEAAISKLGAFENRRVNPTAAKKCYECLVICLKRILDLQPENVFAWINLGIVHHFLRKYEEAIYCADQAITLGTNRNFAFIHLAYYGKGRYLYEKRRNIPDGPDRDRLVRQLLQSAIGELTTCIKMKNDYAPAWQYLAMSKWRLAGIAQNEKDTETQNRLQEDSFSCFNKALELEPENEKSWYEKGLRHYWVKDWPEAIKCFETATKIQDEYIEAWRFLAYSTWELAKGEGDEGKRSTLQAKSFDQFIKVIELEKGENKRTWYDKGYKHFIIKQYEGDEKALYCFERATQIDGEYIEALRYQGMALIKLKRNAKALQCLKKAIICLLRQRHIRLDKKPALAILDDIGYVFNELKFFKNAIRTFEWVLSLDNQRTSAWTSLVYALFYVDTDRAYQRINESLGVLQSDSQRDAVKRRVPGSFSSYLRNSILDGDISSHAELTLKLDKFTEQMGIHGVECPKEDDIRRKSEESAQTGEQKECYNRVFSSPERPG